MKNLIKKTKEESLPDKTINRRNFVSFATFIGLSGLAFGGWRWLYNSVSEQPGITAGVRKPLRKALNQTELFFRRTFSNNHLIKTYPKSLAARKVRVNSDIGIDDKDFKSEDWVLTVNKSSGNPLQVTLKDLMALPKTEIVYDFKCVEGWDQIQYWGGVKFSDFIEHYKLEDQTKLQYAGFATPNKEYYVGIDMPSAMHPQTLLAYEVNDKPLPLEHGLPLRLIIPVKYGIKNLKRIGSISFSDRRPPDYWAEQGYDYYSGL